MASLVIAIVLCVARFGASIDLRHDLTNPWFGVKICAMVSLAVGAATALNRLAIPGSGPVQLRIFLPSLAILALAALLDPSHLPLGGRGPISVPTCVGAIVNLALPALVLLIYMLHRTTAVTRARRAGGVAGLLAGAIGGMTYAFACRNDGGVFIAVWYGTAVSIVALLGALVGRRALSW